MDVTVLTQIKELFRMRAATLFKI